MKLLVCSNKSNNVSQPKNEGEGGGGGGGVVAITSYPDLPPLENTFLVIQI